jgi:hypothetical protein
LADALAASPRWQPELPVDEDGIVMDNPDLFRRVKGIGR